MITFTPGGIEIPWEGLVQGSYSNSDGHGWAVASRDGLEVGKSMSFDKAAAGYEEARNRHGKSSLGLFHSRFGTHGVMGEFNIHPFYVDKEMQTVVAHNGVLPYQYHPLKDDPRSDTRVFVDRVLPHYLSPNGVPSRRRGRQLGQLIGSGNKLTFLSVASGTPKVRIINAHLGEHDSGNWFSNSGYLPSRYYYSGKSHLWDPWDDQYECKPGISTKAEDLFDWTEWSDCKFCHGKYMVNPEDNVCEVCDTCNECWDERERCSCQKDYSDNLPLPVKDYYNNRFQSWK